MTPEQEKQFDEKFPHHLVGELDFEDDVFESIPTVGAIKSFIDTLLEEAREEGEHVGRRSGYIGGATEERSGILKLVEDTRVSWPKQGFDDNDYLPFNAALESLKDKLL